MVKLITLKNGQILNVAQVSVIAPAAAGYSWTEVLMPGRSIRVSLDDRKRIIEALEEMEAACSPRSVVFNPSIEVSAEYAEQVMKEAVWRG